MSDEPQLSESVQLAILQLQSSVNEGFAGNKTEFTAIRGQLDLLIQRQDQQERRVDSQAADLSALDTRVREVETSRATHETVTTLAARVEEIGRETVTHDQLDAGHRRTIGVITAIVSVLGVLLTGAGVGVAIALG